MNNQETIRYFIQPIDEKLPLPSEWNLQLKSEGVEKLQDCVYYTRRIINLESSDGSLAYSIIVAGIHDIVPGIFRLFHKTRIEEHATFYWNQDIGILEITTEKDSMENLSIAVQLFNKLLKRAKLAPESRPKSLLIFLD